MKTLNSIVVVDYCSQLTKLISAFTELSVATTFQMAANQIYQLQISTKLGTCKHSCLVLLSIINRTGVNIVF